MQNIILKKTKSTPYVELNADQNKWIFKGQSYPENAFNFYEPLANWIDDYLAQAPAAIQVELSIPYINTSSSKCLMDILDKLEEAHHRGLKVEVIWTCNEENESEIECAEEFLEDLTLPYRIVIEKE